MKYLITFQLLLALATGYTVTGQQKKFDIFTYEEPDGFHFKKLDAALFYEKKDKKNYCQLFLYPATRSTGAVSSDFEANWDSFARNTEQGVADPESKLTDSANGWQMMTGTARGSYANKPFVINVTTFSNGEICFYTTSVFTHQQYIPAIQEFTSGIVPDIQQFSGLNPLMEIKTENTNQPGPVSGTTGISRPVTRFDDGWLASAQQDYVKLTREQTEIRLLYINDELDKARPNTIDATDYYWNQYVNRDFQITQSEKWSGVEYPVIYYKEGTGIDPETGRNCFVALKIVYSGGARPILVITPDQQKYRQLFTHPNDLDRMLNYNKFAIAPVDITGKWTGSAGGGLHYYNAYTGTYAGMSAISTSDDFQFNGDGTYTSTYRSASTNLGSTQFGAIDYKGNYSVTDWTISATNRLRGKTTLFNAQLIAVKNGYLLYLSDSEAPSMNYTLIKVK